MNALALAKTLPPEPETTEAISTEILKDVLWYKDAVIYQLHIKAFHDANNDGIGDFAGLTQKLDYLQELGVNTLWLLPFYPSPLRDDGYDIADYRNVNPSYGTMDDFQNLVKEVHARGMRIITELVINHTSDQHPWFQAARNAPAGSPERDYYVWSDTDQKYLGTRIIFTDTEKSNWTWDPVAQQYYWHRFFSHQPDLNFDNPRVLEEVIEAMYYWLDMGVDGLRLDAIPYLCERDGTSNENIPETHDIIKKIRAALDARYPDRLLLAEANMWPEDVLPYFGDITENEQGQLVGDECHMAFHFPVMPRIYMAVAQEDRHPITDIMEQTPDIPDNCQWAMFLRNHDELTLEMVTDRERDYMWNFYASERQARINVGIRRRLAPLMENDRRKIELLNGLLMSMPGTPIVYYGDEIGMGDNIFLGDRNGVRTPMQWSPDRNGGFSKADPARLYLPAIMDAVYGFESVNVEAQKRVQYSLLNWTRGLIAARASSQAFGRGTLSFIKPANRKVLAYLRQYGEEIILCVANLSRSPQPAELDLSAFKGYVPMEMLGQSPFPAIGELPYFLTLPPYGFWWFRLTPPQTENQPVVLSFPELSTVVLPAGWNSLMTASARKVLEKQVLPQFLSRQRWYKAKAGALPKVEIQHAYTLDDYRLLLVATTSPEGEMRHYFLGLGIAWESMEEDPFPRVQHHALAKVRQMNRVGVLYEAFNDDGFLRALLNVAVTENGCIESSGTRLCFHKDTQFPEIDAANISITPLGAEQSNTSVLIGDAMVFKAIRQPQEGVSPDEEMGRFFAEQSPFPQTPRMLTTLRIENAEGSSTLSGPLTVGIGHEAVNNQGDGWSFTLDYLKRFASDAALLQSHEQEEALNAKHAYYFDMAQTLGERTAQMHAALAKPSAVETFAPENVSPAHRDLWLKDTLGLAEKARQLVSAAMPKLEPETAGLAQALLNEWGTVETLIRRLLPEKLQAQRIRVHGDYHLGQVLVAQSDFYIIDFEGEPARTLEERKAKHSPYKDVAGMVRSFDYAAAAALQEARTNTAEERQHVAGMLAAWRDAATQTFLAGYANGAASIHDAQSQSLLRFFTLEKALYEIIYEAQNRPTWLSIPLRGVQHLLDADRRAQETED